MPKLKQKDIINNTLKMAFDQEIQLRSKYSYLSDITKDKRLKKMLKIFEQTAQSHLAEIEQEMIKLDIK